MERWEHIVDARTGHPELAAHRDAILRAVSAPDAKGHALRFDGQGALVGVTILNARWLLDHESEIRITIPTPEQIRLRPGQLQHTLAAA